ncbi:Protein grpE [Stanieria cyanosphaera PCC 7437]|uniref:Protein GrpE n=1 Tax=Stanieria cyanosphaera (strain ATCC 29371 / PCC 7437) TaxID=111780 RepID=K9XNW8_STAC7|nr:nucleotide exchange factor GrpE [Stanieria cyanosphaera]AFZ33774.1 Protein grpE [Stanieria cyanosphaera PCC 7437]
MIDEQNPLENTLDNQESISTSFETSDHNDSINPNELSSPDSSVSTATSADSSVIEEVQPETSTVENSLEAENSDFTEAEEIISVLQQENANLKKLLDEQTEQNNNTKAQYARLAADFDNFRRRTSKEKENLEQQTKKSIIIELLPVIDNFERARTQIKPNNEGEQTIHNSYQGVYKTLVDCLKRMGVAAMRPEGEQFDPNFHEAMLREATNEHPEGTVIEQLMRGYLLGDQVLRHAMVKVAVPKEPMITSEEETAKVED